MKFKRLTIMLLVAVMVFGGIGAQTYRLASAQDRINLKFYIWSDEENYMTEVADNYNQSQENVEVEVVSIPNDSYDDKLKVMLAGGSDADIVDIRTLNQVIQFRNFGALMDLTDMVENSDLDISKYGAMWDAQYPDGQIYALPTRTTNWMLFYNEDIFEEEGITMPDQLTWDEYAELAKSLTTENRYGGYWINWDIYNAYAIQKGTYFDAEDTTDLRQSLALINRLQNIDESHPTLAEVQATNAQFMAAFENERAVMMPQGEWMINMLLTDINAGKTDINWSVAPMPVPEGVEPGTTWGQFQFAGIPAGVDHPEESFKFLKYLSSTGGSSVLPKYGMLPAYSGEEAQEVFAEVVGKEQVVDVVFNSKKILEQPPLDNYSELIQTFGENAQLYLLGEKDLDETINNFERQRENILE